MNKLGESIKTKCANCGRELIITYSKYHNSKTCNFFCNKKCKTNWQKGRPLSKETIEKMKIANIGENNGNYKDGHTIKKHYCKCGNEKDYRSKQCNSCYLRKPFLGKKHSKKSLLIISKKSREKFTPEYRIKQRKKNEDLGIWIPLNKLDDYNFYYCLYEWQERMFNLQIKGKKLLENGIYNTNNNRKGVVRDHRLSRKTGLRLLIFPEILRHPCNCELLTQSQNISKGRKNLDSISIEDLFIKIINYNDHWFEQEKCIFLIEEYKKGKRYVRKEYEEVVPV